MNYALCVGTCRMDGGMDNKPGGIDGDRALFEYRAVEIDFDQRRGRDFFEQQSERVDQEPMSRSWEAHGDMGGEKIVPAKGGHDAIKGREIDPQPTLCVILTCQGC